MSESRTSLEHAPPGSMHGKVVMITGAARGIGAETARRLAARGATLSLVGMEPPLLRELAGSLGPSHVWCACDVTDQRALEGAVAETVARAGGIDVVVANAGIACRGTVAVADIEAMARVIDVNLTGVFRTVKAALPHVIERKGYVLVVSSAAAFSAMPGIAAYAASKAGVEQFANVLRLEVAHHGVDVGSAHMTWIDTDLVRDVRKDSTVFNRMLAKMPGPFGTITSLVDCADAFVRAIERRERKLFVPSSLGRASMLRQLLGSAFVQRSMLARLGASVRASEDEAQGLGRSFGETSVGMGKVESS